MNAAHQMVSLAHATVGMVLSDAILDHLARHDVVMLPIALAGDAAPAIDAAAVAARVAYLFRADGLELSAGPADTATAVLHRYIAEYRLGQDMAPGVAP